MPDLLITGTDTGVGKTVIAAAFVKAMRQRGVRAIGFKPVESGCDGQHPNDSDVLADAAGAPGSLTRPLLQLREPLAPAVAAERAGISMEPRHIEARIEELRREGYRLIVEGAGGVTVPLLWGSGGDARGYTVLDLASRFGMHAIIVGRAGLGTLNHVVMTASMLAAKQIPLQGVVLNGRSSAPDLAESTNPSVLSRLLPGIQIIEVPRHEAADVVSATVPFVSSLL